MGRLPGVILLALVFVGGVYSLSNIPANMEQKIDDFIAEILRCRPVAGLTLSLVNKTHTLLTKGYGKANLDRGDPVTDTTLYCIASLSKAFSTTLLGVLLEEQADTGYAWTSTVRDVIGDHLYFLDAPRTLGATLRDISAHRMGLATYNNMRLMDNLTREELAHKVRFFEAAGDFRDSYIYNNMMYGIVSHAAEQLGGMSWEQLITDKLFQPLGMTSSSFTNVIDLNRPDVATAYITDASRELREVSRELISRWGELGGSGAIVSNAADMSQWMKTLLNRGATESGHQAISQKVFRELVTPVATTGHWTNLDSYQRPNIPVTFARASYGLGWYQAWYRGWRVLQHSGSSWGSLSNIVLMPDTNLAVYLSLTGDDPGYHVRTMVALYALDLLLGVEPWLNTSHACDFPPSYRRDMARLVSYRTVRVNKFARATRPLHAYQGTYGHFLFGNVSVYVDSVPTEQLMLRYGSLGLWKLHPTSNPDTFDGQGVDHVWSMTMPNTAFHWEDSSKSGSITSVEIPGLEWTVKPIFHRDLKMSEAPPPPDLDCPKGTSQSPASSGSHVSSPVSSESHMSSPVSSGSHVSVSGIVRAIGLFQTVLYRRTHL